MSIKRFAMLLVSCFVLVQSVDAQALDKQRLLSDETFWDNQDFDWYSSVERQLVFLSRDN